jgi:hypothetical protein
MRRTFLACVAVAVTAAVAASAALADNPHFIKADGALSGTNLRGTFKIAGLGNNQSIEVLLTADAEAQYACFNRGGKHPQATNKETVAGPVSASGEFTSGKNGQVNGSLTVGPPSQGSFSCPPGQRLAVPYVKYTNVQICFDFTVNQQVDANAICEPVAGTFEAGAKV